VIPAHWIPQFRGRDDELVGYLMPSGDGAVPMTLFGQPLVVISDDFGVGGPLGEAFLLDVRRDRPAVSAKLISIGPQPTSMKCSATGG
jgi:hypothetical protein